MRKNYSWPIELIIIIGVFFMINQCFLLSGCSIIYPLFIGYTTGFIGMLVFLIFAIFRINETSRNNNNHSLGYYLKNKFLPNDIWKVLLLIFVGNLTYILTLKMEFVHVFDGIKPTFNSHITVFQSWYIVSFIVLMIPIGVMAEELYFRCYLFEIQQKRFEKYTWIINGFSWSIYHLFSSTNFLAFLPTCLLYSYIYQKRRNVWITIFAHLILNILAFYPVIKSFILIAK